jgi:D-alanyl-lipoteichoic acid acyltransferase DltB (MBOAT superfamily)
MLFNSVEYLLLFLPLSLVVFQLLASTSGTERQINWLVIASLFFYASWKPVYLLLIISSILVNFTLGKKLAGDHSHGARKWLVLGVCFNLGLLGYFKYTGFFVEGLNAFGVWLIPVPEITLPLAISFFTFQQIAYLVDVSRGNCEEYQFSHYALFVLFFPQLIAGPIVHHTEVMPQFARPRARADIPTDLAVGITFIAAGLFKKVVLADTLGLITDPVFDAAAQGTPVNTVDALLGSFAFSFQIYFDFSGYSDIAIGSARLFGIRLPENFRSPYKSRSMIEVWNRWHMTLSRFLRDYLYFSLGGNRSGSFNRYRNLMITMLLGGLWHGAAWTFVVWGAFHGLFLWANHGWRAISARLGLQQVLASPLLVPLFVLLTFTAWTIAVVSFRAADLPTAWTMLSAGFLEFSGTAAPVLGEAFQDSFLSRVLPLLGLEHSSYGETWLLMGIAAAICWLLPNTQEFLGNYDPVIIADNAPLPPASISWRPGFAYALLTTVLLSCGLLGLSSISRFYYFQF